MNIGRRSILGLMGGLLIFPKPLLAKSLPSPTVLEYVGQIKLILEPHLENQILTLLPVEWDRIMVVVSDIFIDYDKSFGSTLHTTTGIVKGRNFTEDEFDEIQKLCQEWFESQKQ